MNECQACGEIGDFARSNDARIAAAETFAIKASIPNMLEQLASQGITMSFFERALSIPPRTLARWKAGEASAAPVALLRLVTTFPWLLTVADHGYDRAICQQCVIVEAGRIIHNVATQHQLALASITTTANEGGAAVNLAFARFGASQYDANTLRVNANTLQVMLVGGN